VLKRSLDILLAALLLTLALPFLALAAITIKWDSEGPVIFRQIRMGRNFKCFELWKLRTMRHSSSGLAYTLGADPRITRSGRWLRWFKIDELPQLWNVLRGDMSMVGPRPVVPELTTEFKKAYEQLLRARPGLTDPATLKYCHEAEMLTAIADPLGYFKTVVTPDKLRISQAYRQRANTWSDLGVMAETALILFRSIRRARFSPAASARLDRVTELISAEALRRRNVQSAIESDWLSRSMEPAAIGRNHGRYGGVVLGRLAQRHFRRGAPPETGDRRRVLS
jgi:lipopolysaccharide/colanic/teichoic acid biosynthesis glycosyltransferase